MKTTRLFLAIPAAAVALSSLYVHAETVKIALADPVSSSVARYDDMIKAGALTAIEQMNAANGTKLEPVIMNGACESKQTVVIPNKIVSQGIKFFIRHVCSGLTIPASEIYENEGVLMVTSTQVEGGTVYPIEQNAHKALQDSDPGYMPTTGHVVLADAERNFLANDHIKKAYWGG